MTPTVRALLACGAGITTTSNQVERTTFIFVTVPRLDADFAFQVELSDLERHGAGSREKLEQLVEEKINEAIKDIYDKAKANNLEYEQRAIAHERVQGQDQRVQDAQA